MAWDNLRLRTSPAVLLCSQPVSNLNVWEQHIQPYYILDFPCNQHLQFKLSA